MTGRTDSRLQRAQTTSDGTELLARDISSTMRYTVDPRVGPPKKNRSAKGRQQDRCHDEGQRTRPRTNAMRPAEPASALVAAEQIASILIQFATWLLERRGEGSNAAM